MEPTFTYNSVFVHCMFHDLMVVNQFFPVFLVSHHLVMKAFLGKHYNIYFDLTA